VDFLLVLIEFFL